MDNSEATSYLTSLLNKTLRVHTTDTRIFVGQMKCTDKVGLSGLGLASYAVRPDNYSQTTIKDRNLILSLTHEYRHPPASTVQDAASDMQQSGATGNVRVDMIRRFVGLVVVPGQYITKIEVEG